MSNRGPPLGVTALLLRALEAFGLEEEEEEGSTPGRSRGPAATRVTSGCHGNQDSLRDSELRLVLARAVACRA